MRKVMVPIDGSPQALQALRAAVREGPGAIERIELVNVQPLLHRHIAEWVPRAVRDQWRAERAARTLEPARLIVSRSAIPYRMHIVAGPMARAIDDAARTLGVDEVAFTPRAGLGGRLVIPAGIGLAALLFLASE